MPYGLGTAIQPFIYYIN